VRQDLYIAIKLGWMNIKSFNVLMVGCTRDVSQIPEIVKSLFSVVHSSRNTGMTNEDILDSLKSYRLEIKQMDRLYTLVSGWGVSEFKIALDRTLAIASITPDANLESALFETIARLSGKNSEKLLEKSGWREIGGYTQTKVCTVFLIE
jgi:hypothetical protein